MVIKISKCCFCGCDEFIYDAQKNYAALQGEGALTTAVLKHTICRNCGSVVRSYVEDPEELLKFKNRKDKKCI